MRWLLSFCFAGLVAYALIPPRAEPVEHADAGISTARTEAAKAAGRELRSWGSTLQSLGSRAQPAKSQQSDTQQPLQQEAGYRPGGVEVRGPEPALGKGESVGPNSSAQIVEAVAEPVAWARVVFAARTHSEASVSSPIIKFYPAGTELQVVAQKGSWIQLLDPATSKRGWVFDQYLVSIDAPGQAPLATTAEAQPAEAAPPNVQTVRRSSKKAAASKRNEITRKARRQSGWAKKRDRRERKRRRAFRRDARPAAWSLGSPQ